MSIRLHTTAIGKAIMAAMPDETVRATLERTGMEARTPTSITDPEALLADLAAIRERGYSIDDEENEPGIRCVGAVVFDHTGRPSGAVSVSTLSMEPWQLTLDELGGHVRRAAAEISASLGAPPRTVS
jgi:DNA-binding IclR family transcriptional regulator